MNAQTLWEARPAELAEILSDGYAIEPSALVGSYRGVSLGLPAFVDRIAWKIFRKRFARDPSDPDAIIGHNVRVQQSDTVTPIEGSGPPKALMRGGSDLVFGPFAVRALTSATPFRCRAGVLLDYGAAHPMWHPLARLRDPLVAVRAGSVELLLGASYLDLGVSLRTPSYFTLEREPELV